MIPIRKFMASKSPSEIAQLRQDGNLRPPLVSMVDLRSALASTNKSISQEMISYFRDWNTRFGSR